MNYRAWIISRLVILLLLTLIVTKPFVQYSHNQYDLGRKLEQIEKSVDLKDVKKDFQDLKEDLLSSEKNKNYSYSFLVLLVSFAFIISSYEIIAFLLTRTLSKILD